MYRFLSTYNENYLELIKLEKKVPLAATGESSVSPC